MKLFGHFFDRIGTFFKIIFWVSLRDSDKRRIFIRFFANFLLQIFFEKTLAGSKLSDKLTVPRR